METHPSWFIGGKSVDADDVIEPFKVQDNKKTNLLNFFLEKCRVQPICGWISRWEKVFNVIDSALRDKSESITNKNEPKIFPVTLQIIKLHNRLCAPRLHIHLINQE